MNEFLRNVTLAAPKIEKIALQSLEVPIPTLDGSVIIFQRHGKDNRDPKEILVPLGALMPESIHQIHSRVKESFDRLFAGLTPEERETIDIFVVSSDTSLRLPDKNITSPRKRAVETAEVVINALQESMKGYALSEEHLLNKTKHPIELKSGIIKDVDILDHSPEFVQFLVDKYGTGQAFWEAYENDKEREKRLQMHAEGPEDVANRIKSYLLKLEHALKSYHQHHPGRRVIVWADTHYDTISAFIKRDVIGMDPHDYLPVENGAGIAIEIDNKNQAKTTIQGQEYHVSLKKTV